MKQYTTQDQTAKLIELGFEKPKSEVRSERGPFSSDARKAYSIGELIEIIDGKVTLGIDKLGARWIVSVLIFNFTGEELIDCLFDACITLKEEGVI